jgi:hypothetical protein
LILNSDWNQYFSDSRGKGTAAWSLVTAKNFQLVTSFPFGIQKLVSAVLVLSLFAICYTYERANYKSEDGKINLMGKFAALHLLYSQYLTPVLHVLYCHTLLAWFTL